ncbi:MAG: transcriptional repressor [Dehalococcoidia bacterium]|nr:transcriptional repressor [Dehalococcoidia bacterium]
MIKMQELSGQRVTSQRRLLLDLLRHSEGHLDADELYRLAKEREPRISLSTVYRALSLFKELGLVEERHFADEHHHYEVKRKREHHHLVCLGCGKVVEFQSPLTKRIKEDVSRQSGFEILNASVSLEGYCERCRQERG